MRWLSLLYTSVTKRAGMLIIISIAVLLCTISKFPLSATELTDMKLRHKPAFFLSSLTKRSSTSVR
jgi:hypothetical protein